MNLSLLIGGCVCKTLVKVVGNVISKYRNVFVEGRKALMQCS